MAGSVGFHDRSSMDASIMLCTFVASYVNSAIVPILTNADLRFAPWPLNLLPIHQQYTDLTIQWYLRIGPQILQNVMIQTSMPLVGAVALLVLSSVPRWFDRGCLCCKSRKTKAKN